MPQFSVVVPTYNRAGMISRAIESVLNQTFDGFELIIVDDGSTDDTAQVVAEYDDERITHIKQENAGANAARNHGIQAATGDYITFLDSDDRLCNEYLDVTRSAFADADDECAGVFSYFHVVYRDGERDPREHYVGKLRLEDYETNCIGSFTGATIRADVLEEIGELDESLPKGQDVDLWVRVMENGYYLLGVDEFLFEYNVHDGQMGLEPSRVVGELRLLQKHADVLPRKHRAKRCHKVGSAMLVTGNPLKARGLLFRAIVLNPTKWYYWYHFGLSLFGATAFKKGTPNTRYVN